jgi:hypothetical protein
MPMREDVIAAADNIVEKVAASRYSNSATTNDIYENCIWALCLQAARQHRASIRYEDRNEKAITALTFRTSPGAIYSIAHPYAHGVIEFAGCPPLEAHVGIRVAGRSRVLHGFDVAVLDKEEARLCRSNRVHPRASKVLIGAECRYTSAIQLYLGRRFLGFASDIHRKECCSVTDWLSPSLTKLIARHQSEWKCGVLPKPADADALLHSFARAFRNYKVRFDPNYSRPSRPDTEGLNVGREGME